MRGADLSGISGLHFHTLCEQSAEDLADTLEAVEQYFGSILSRPEITWLNMGGGHWITKPGYNRELLANLVRGIRSRYGVDVWLEPGGGGRHPFRRAALPGAGRFFLRGGGTRHSGRFRVLPTCRTRWKCPTGRMCFRF